MVVQGAPKGPITRSRQQQDSTNNKTRQPTVTARRSTLSKITPTTGRLSTSSSTIRPPKLQAPTLTSQQSIIDQLLKRVSELEEVSSTLVDRIDNLSETVKSLSHTVAEQRKVIDTYEETAEASSNGVSVEQERVNSNIVVRGLDIDENTTESALIETFERICAHIGIPEAELKPISAEILPSSSSNKKKANRPFIVSLSSREAKQKFLQARRIKRDIRPSEINREQNVNKPLIITEQLTRDNQKLLFEARSLRGRDKFKFIWTNNGQILARRKKRSSVIRIRDSSDVERLRASLTKPDNGGSPRGARSRQKHQDTVQE